MIWMQHFSNFLVSERFSLLFSELDSFLQEPRSLADDCHPKDLDAGMMNHGEVLILRWDLKIVGNGIKLDISGEC